MRNNNFYFWLLFSQIGCYQGVRRGTGFWRTPESTAFACGQLWRSVQFKHNVSYAGNKIQPKAIGSVLAGRGRLSQRCGYRVPGRKQRHRPASFRGRPIACRAVPKLQQLHAVQHPLRSASQPAQHTVQTLHLNSLQRRTPNLRTAWQLAHQRRFSLKGF